MVKKLLGLILAILMAMPTTSFAQEDVFAPVRNQPSGVRVVLELHDGPTLKGSLVSVSDDALVVGTLDRVRESATLRNAPGIPGAYVFAPSEVARVGLEPNQRNFYVVAPGQSADPDAVRRAVARLKVGRTVNVTTSVGRTYRGSLTRANDEGFDLIVGGRVVTVAYSDVVAVGPTGMGRIEKALLHTGLAMATLWAAYVGLMWSLCSHGC